MITREPVTVSGWYEHHDSTWGYYQWVDGRLVLVRVAPTPESPQERDARLLFELDDMNAARA